MTQLTKITKDYSNRTLVIFIWAGLVLLLGVILFHQAINKSVGAADLGKFSSSSVILNSFQDLDTPPITIQKEVTEDQRNLSVRPPFPKDAGYSIQFLYNQTYPDPPFLMQE